MSSSIDDHPSAFSFQAASAEQHSARRARINDLADEAIAQSNPREALLELFAADLARCQLVVTGVLESEFNSGITTLEELAAVLPHIAASTRLTKQVHNIFKSCRSIGRSSEQPTLSPIQPQREEGVATSHSASDAVAETIVEQVITDNYQEATLTERESEKLTN